MTSGWKGKQFKDIEGVAEDPCGDSPPHAAQESSITGISVLIHDWTILEIFLRNEK